MVSTQFASSYPPNMDGPLSTHVPPPPPVPSLSPPNSSSKKRPSNQLPPPPPPPPSTAASQSVDGSAISKKPKLSNSPPPPPPPVPPPPPTQAPRQANTLAPKKSLPPPPPPPPPSQPPSSLSSSISGSRSLPQGGIQRSNPTTSIPPPPPPPPAPSSKPVENRKKVVPPPPPPVPVASLAPRKSALISLPKGRFNQAAIQQARNCRDVSDFERVCQVGRGAYGEVFKAKCNKTNKLVALKQLKMVTAERDGFPGYSIREINILNNMKSHKNIVNLLEIVTRGARRGATASPGDEDESGDKSSIFMVFEYLEYDLEGLLLASKSDPSVKITSSHVRSWTYQLLEGINFLHKNGVMHRDLKGGNVLVGANNTIKIADFGLARSLSDSPKKYTKNLITLGYRPPEIMMGMLKYGTPADMWSIGAIFGYLLLKKPMFPCFKEQTEIDHLHSIFKLCGTPKVDPVTAQGLAPNPDYRFDVWPSVQQDCPDFHLHAALAPMPRLLQTCFDGNVHVSGVNRVGKLGISPQAVDLIEKLLHLDPKQRLTASEALDHDYFFAEGGVKQVESLPRFKLASAHEMESRNREKEQHDKLMAQHQAKLLANGLAQANP